MKTNPLKKSQKQTNRPARYAFHMTYNCTGKIKVNKPPPVFWTYVEQTRASCTQCRNNNFLWTWQRYTLPAGCQQGHALDVTRVNSVDCSIYGIRQFRSVCCYVFALQPPTHYFSLSGLPQSCTIKKRLKNKVVYEFRVHTTVTTTVIVSTKVSPNFRGLASSFFAQEIFTKVTIFCLFCSCNVIISLQANAKVASSRHCHMS